MALLEAPVHRWIILHALFSPRIAGAERYCLDLANQQAALGHRVHLAGISGSPMRDALAPGVSFHAIDTPLLRGLRMAHLMSRLKADICHAHLSPACKAASRISSGVTRIATLHVGYKKHQHGQLNGVICVNRAQSSRLKDFQGTARVIPNWLTSTERRSQSAISLRSELGLRSTQFLIGAVGRLHASKGMDVLISAFKATAPHDAALVIVGEGPQRAELERLCTGDRRIHLMGYRSDVRRLLGDIDLFVSPSREETFGLAILEAMHAGLPIISTATEGPKEIFDRQGIEWVTPASIPELSRSLGRAFTHRIDQALCRVEYDLSPFEASRAVSTVMDFYLHSVRQRQESTRGFKPRPVVAAVV